MIKAACKLGSPKTGDEFHATADLKQLPTLKLAEAVEFLSNEESTSHYELSFKLISFD